MIKTRLFVGNLAFQTTEHDVHQAFSEVAAVNEVKLMLDRDSGRSRGFAFVDMQSSEGAVKAVTAMNGRNFQGRELRVSEALERQTDSRPFNGRERR